jgi:hypothetical protein
MENTAETAQVSSELRSALAESQATAREQLIAAWQLHIDRVREELESGWREQMELIFQQRFAEIEAKLQENFDRAVEGLVTAAVTTKVEQERGATERNLSDQLNQAARRLRSSDSRETWIATLLEAASSFCDRAALFRVNAGQQVKFEGGLGVGEDDEVEFPASSAPAFANAIESKDTVVAVATRRELSDAVVDLFGGSEGSKIYLFPLVLHREAVGVLTAESEERATNVSALELITSLAVQSITEEEEVTVQPPSADLVGITGINLPPPNIANTQLSVLPKSDQEAHLRAQRFARTQVARLLLYKVEKVREGRAARNLYANLKEEIDAGRDAFRRQFMAACPSMVDYYHVELVGTLGRNDGAVLGPEYPGPLP